MDCAGFSNGSSIGLHSFVGVSSRSKKSDDVVPVQTQTTTTAPQTATTTIQTGFQVKIDGKMYAPDFSYALAAFPGADGYYAIYGLDSKTSDVIALALQTTANEGTYPLSTEKSHGLLRV